ncbi:DNA-binding response regulator [Hahella sp. CCB-MM4]|uniref:response regulator transcription factor n=1 Tax=Hahella sp. (strain CCB-MM4) TaxID=1926491 RepID=UPI000B9C6E5E|nr:response regulator transcription factor [Hahella sp. CCB-MM4]OZG71189.1 DNA-binding response regulator [Hahella sp. CCB-MM4]
MNVLLIDDDINLARLLKQYLDGYQWQMLHAAAPSDAYRKINEQMAGEQPLDAIILDIMLPEEDGFQVCRRIREKWDIPIIMLTARGDVTDRVVGLELGADDYLPKPFEPRELVARIQTIIRRLGRAAERNDSKNPDQTLKFKGITIQPLTQEVAVEGLPVKLTTSEFRLLHLFASSPGKVFSRDDIMNELRGTEVELFSRSVDITVSRLRQKLKMKSKRMFITTVWGSGYRFTGEALA